MVGQIRARQTQKQECNVNVKFKAKSSKSEQGDGIKGTVAKAARCLRNAHSFSPLLAKPQFNLAQQCVQTKKIVYLLLQLGGGQYVISRV